MIRDLVGDGAASESSLPHHVFGEKIRCRNAGMLEMSRHQQRDIQPPLVVPRLLPNPVLPIDFPDPDLVYVSAKDAAWKRAAAGWYLFGSQGKDGGGAPVNIQAAYSPDAVDWQYRGEVLPKLPSFAGGLRDCWAPHVRFCEATGDWRLFFNARIAAYTDRNKQAIAVAVSGSPLGPFAPVEDGRAPWLAVGLHYTEIDASVFVDHETGTSYLLSGSRQRPLRARRLSEDLLSVEGNRRYMLLRTDRRDPARPWDSMYEAASVHYLRSDLDGKNYYYLLYSGPDSFGSDSYAISAARSARALGPYQTKAQLTRATDSIIFRGNGAAMNPGHHGAAADGEGNMLVAYHIYLRTELPLLDGLSKEEIRRTLCPLSRYPCLAPLSVVNGWPQIGSGSPTIGPVLGTATTT